MSERIGPPEVTLDPNVLVLDERRRHEAIVDLFGRYIMWLRDAALNSSCAQVADQNAKEKLGFLHWKRYEGVAAMAPADKERALQFAEATVDRFIEFLLTMLAGTGVDQRVTSSIATRFKLDMELVDVESDDVIHTETVNRGGERFFVSYWGRWLNAVKQKGGEADSGSE